MPRTVILMRHGRPARMPRWTTARGLAAWQARYADAGIVDAPPAEARRLAAEARSLFASPLARTWQSAAALAGGRTITTIADAAEPGLRTLRHRTPPLPARLVLALARAAWLMGRHGGAEPVAHARARAGRVAARLAEASADGPAMLVGHGIQNHLIGAALRRAGWRRTRGATGASYWSAQVYERQERKAS